MPRKRSFLQDLVDYDCFRTSVKIQWPDIYIFVGVRVVKTNPVPSLTRLLG